jgi:branched-chain amino acid transport system substrate-binding protein
MRAVICGGWAGLFLTAGLLFAQTNGPGAASAGPGCECGRHAPGPPRDRTVAPYAGTPEDLEPYGKFAHPYDLNYTRPNIYVGPGREIPDPADLQEIRIGFLGPIEKQADQVYGLRMLHGAQLAIDEANARGGYGGKPFRLMIHDDYNNWQRGSEYGAERPTDAKIWGSTSDEAVRMIYDDQDWAIFGSINSESTHIVLRVALKAEIPIVNSASTDPTIPETYIPWYFTDLQDDRVQSYTLARRIFTELGLKRAALLRVNNRYGRFGVIKFRDASRRLGHPVVIEQKFLPGETDFRRQLTVIRDSRADAIVLWADQPEAAGILKQMRQLGMKQRVFGSHRTLGEDLLRQAGTAAEGFEAVFPYDPTQSSAHWVDFQRRFEARFGEKPEAFGSLAYDAMNALLESICRAGLNRVRIHDALAGLEEYNGVTGPMIFDPNGKNVSPMYLGTVRNGKVEYRLAPLALLRKGIAGQNAPVTGDRMPYARVGEDGVTFNGPPVANIPGDAAAVVVFGGRAAELTAQLKSSAGSFRLISVESGQNWGAASTQLVHAIFDEHALAVVALDRDAAHLAEQLSLKAFVPVVALADDRVLTSTNIPWIFRLPASAGAAEALRVLAEAERVSGTNPQRLRDVLASGATAAGVRFLSTGEPAK